jgi:TRAP-type mannitol/chloroaromatic compound transport system permease small subunit
MAMRAFLRSLAAGIDRLNHAAGWLSALSVLLVTVLATLTAFGRKFGIGSNAFIELQWYLFALIFLLAAAWTMQRDEHVRVDVFAKHWSLQTRAWIDIVGHVLVLLPLAGLLFWLGSKQTISMYLSGEQSPDAGGLIRWPVWALVPIGFLLLILQTLADLGRKLLIVTRSTRIKHDDLSEHQP